MKHIADMDDIPTNFFIKTIGINIKNLMLFHYQKLEIIKHQLSVFSTRIEKKKYSQK